MISRLKDFLNRNGVNYVSYYHNPIYSAEELSLFLGEPIENIVKSMVVGIAGEYIMIVLPGHCEVDLDLLAESLLTDEISFTSESVLETLFPDCETGAIPPFGNLYGMDVYVESGLNDIEEIIFNGGTFRDTVKIRFNEYKNIVNPHIIGFCVYN